MKLNSFNLIAPYYDTLASFVFGSSIRKAQLQFLSTIPAGANVLVLGGGTGWWLPELHKINPTCSVWFIDSSSEMIKRVNERKVPRVFTIHGTEENIPEMEYDAVITFFFLDMFNESCLHAVVNQINSHLKLSGIWLISDFISKQFWHRVLLSCMYFFFRLIGAIRTQNLSDWQLALSKARLIV